MQAIAHDILGERQAHLGSKVITTTLYDLIEAINEEVSPEEDGLVTQIIQRLLYTGKIKFLELT